MAFEGRKECAVRECSSPCSLRANLCVVHLVPGMAFEYGNSTGVVTSWYAEHAIERGIILLNDFALGDLFGGAPGFKAKLEQQGFVKVRNLRTPEEFGTAKAQSSKSPASWSGPWLTEYPWEICGQSEAVVREGGGGSSR